eukprot:1158454-Pelagomonas_calceolata.AAC.23
MHSKCHAGTRAKYALQKYVPNASPQSLPTVMQEYVPSVSQQYKIFACQLPCSHVCQMPCREKSARRDLQQYC